MQKNQVIENEEVEGDPTQEKANPEAEVSPADYDDREAGNAPAPDEPTGESIEGSGEEVSAPESEEHPTNPEGDQGRGAEDSPEGGNGKPPEEAGNVEEAEPVEAPEAEVEPESESEPEEVETVGQSDPVTTEERQEFDQLSTKRHNMPLNEKEVARYDEINRKING